MALLTITMIFQLQLLLCQVYLKGRARPLNICYVEQHITECPKLDIVVSVIRLNLPSKAVPSQKVNQSPTQTKPYNISPYYTEKSRND